jgi:hypothetical protein
MSSWVTTSPEDLRAALVSNAWAIIEDHEPVDGGVCPVCKVVRCGMRTDSVAYLLAIDAYAAGPPAATVSDSR